MSFILTSNSTIAHKGPNLTFFRLIRVILTLFDLV